MRPPQLSSTLSPAPLLPLQYDTQSKFIHHISVFRLFCNNCGMSNRRKKRRRRNLLVARNFENDGFYNTDQCSSSFISNKQTYLFWRGLPASLHRFLQFSHARKQFILDYLSKKVHSAQSSCADKCFGLLQLCFY